MLKSGKDYSAGADGRDGMVMLQRLRDLQGQLTAAVPFAQSFAGGVKDVAQVASTAAAAAALGIRIVKPIVLKVFATCVQQMFD
jgi:hypothetical protein